MINNLLKNSWKIYVDDATSGIKIIQQGKLFYNKAKLILSDASSNLTKWVINDSNLQVFLGQWKNRAPNVVPNWGTDFGTIKSHLDLAY